MHNIVEVNAEDADDLYATVVSRGTDVAEQDHTIRKCGTTSGDVPCANGLQVGEAERSALCVEDRRIFLAAAYTIIAKDGIAILVLRDMCVQ